MSDLAFLTATELGPLLQSRQLAPVELTEHLLKRIEQNNLIINAYITPLNDLAIQQAKEAEVIMRKVNTKVLCPGSPFSWHFNRYSSIHQSSTSPKKARLFL